MTALRDSVRATYDGRETGPRYHVTTMLDDQTIKFRAPVDDPFVHTTVKVHWWDLLKALFRGGLTISVVVGGDKEIQDDVLELDENNLIVGRTRNAAFRSHLNEAMGRMVEGDDQ